MVVALVGQWSKSEEARGVALPFGSKRCSLAVVDVEGKPPEQTAIVKVGEGERKWQEDVCK